MHLHYTWDPSETCGECKAKNLRLEIINQIDVKKIIPLWGPEPALYIRAGQGKSGVTVSIGKPWLSHTRIIRGRRIHIYIYIYMYIYIQLCTKPPVMLSHARRSTDIWVWRAMGVGAGSVY